MTGTPIYKKGDIITLTDHYLYSGQSVQITYIPRHTENLYYGLVLDTTAEVRFLSRQIQNPSLEEYEVCE